MQFKVLVASLLASAGLSAAAPLEARQDSCPTIAKNGDYVWEISNFSVRKPGGEALTEFTMDVTTTRGTLADFKCTSSDVADDKWYPCENKMVSFAFQNERSGLILKFVNIYGEEMVATTTILSTCHHGPNGGGDYICEGTSPAYVTLVGTPKSE